MTDSRYLSRPRLIPGNIIPYWEPRPAHFLGFIFINTLGSSRTNVLCNMNTSSCNFVGVKLRFILVLYTSALFAVGLY